MESIKDHMLVDLAKPYHSDTIPQDCGRGHSWAVHLGAEFRGVRIISNKHHQGYGSALNGPAKKFSSRIFTLWLIEMM